MIEGKIETAPVGNPHRRACVRSGPGFCRSRQEGREDDTHGVPARIAPRIGIDADKLERADREPGLFENLAPAGRFDRLAYIDEPAGKGVLASERLVLAADENDTSVIVADHAIRREQRCLSPGHGSPE
jgi:hypothetical protein